MPFPRRPLRPTRSATDWLGAEVRHWRELRDMSVRELGRAIGLSTDGVEKIEKGDRLCSAEHARLMDDVLRTGGVLARFQPYAKAEADRRRREADSRTAVPVLSAPGVILAEREPAKDPLVEPHAFAVISAEGSWDDPALVLAQLRSLTGNSMNGTTSVLESSVHALVEAYEGRGPHTLASDARGLRSLTYQLLGDRTLPPPARRDLFHLAGQVSGLLAYMAVNAGASLLTCQTYAAEAAALADEIGDTSLAVWVAGTRSLALYYAGSYRQADAVAAAGIARSPSSPQAIRLLVNGRARALGRLHDSYGAETAIGQAIALAEKTDLPNGLTSCIALDVPYSHARLLANAVTARLSLGDTSKVHALAAQIEGQVDSSDSAWSRALVRLDQATACLQGPTPDLERAMELGTQALRAGAATPIRSVLQRAQELQQAAAPWYTHAAVQDYAEALTAWRAAPAASTLTT